MLSLSLDQSFFMLLLRVLTQTTPARQYVRTLLPCLFVGYIDQKSVSAQARPAAGRRRRVSVLMTVAAQHASRFLARETAERTLRI